MTSAGQGILSRFAHAWRAPRAAARAEAESAPDERRLLAYAFGASIFLTLGPVAAEIAAPRIAPEIRADWLGAQLAAGFAFTPLGLYLGAALLNLALMAVGRGGEWRAARLAVFWSALVSGPLAVLAHVGAALPGASEFGATLAGAVWTFWLAPAVIEVLGTPPRATYAVFAALIAAAFALDAVIG